MPKSHTRAAADVPRHNEIPIDLETHRRLRRDLELTPQEIAAIDIDLAIEAGLLEKPKASLAKAPLPGPCGADDY